jgi:alkane 1-monooxygenase
MRYFFALLTGVLGLLGLNIGGLCVWALPCFAFLLVPLLELLAPPDASNLEEKEEAQIKKDPLYDYVLYTAALLHGAVVGSFFLKLPSAALGNLWEIMGCVFTLGISCGVLGINIAHELGHRSSRSEKIMAGLLLLSSLYMHFTIEHNRGHHKWVATPQDPSSARLGESLYAFWIRSITGVYFSAWRLERSRLEKKGLKFWSFRNQMLTLTLVQIFWVVLIFQIGGAYVGIVYLIAALIGILLLESVNYIEHYGLCRNEISPGHYERVTPVHSWNSNHRVGRSLLFELSRHSDHHYNAARKYQILRHHENSPQMPTGYPGMILLALFPPFWFKVMNPKIERLQAAKAA